MSLQNIAYLTVIYMLVIKNKGKGRTKKCDLFTLQQGARCSSVVRAFAHGAMGRRIDPSR